MRVPHPRLVLALMMTLLFFRVSVFTLAWACFLVPVLAHLDLALLHAPQDGKEDAGRPIVFFFTLIRFH